MSRILACCPFFWMDRWCFCLFHICWMSRQMAFIVQLFLPFNSFGDTSSTPGILFVFRQEFVGIRIAQPFVDGFEGHWMHQMAWRFFSISNAAPNFLFPFSFRLLRYLVCIVRPVEGECLVLKGGPYILGSNRVVWSLFAWLFPLAFVDKWLTARRSWKP